MNQTSLAKNYNIGC